MLISLIRLWSIVCSKKAPLAIISGLVFTGCASVIEAPPITPGSFGEFPFNGGRTQAISIHPFDDNRIIIANQFGGFWRTENGGDSWNKVSGLKTTFGVDVQHGHDGRTLVATLRQDTQRVNGGGIYVSWDGGDTWTRPDTANIPLNSRTPIRSSAWGITTPPDEPGTWLVGTNYGVARSTDDGRTWQHFQVAVNTRTLTADLFQDAVYSIVALRDGVVLAHLENGVYLSRDSGANWQLSRPYNGPFYTKAEAINLLDRDRRGVSAYAVQDYQNLHYFDGTVNRWTTMPLPAIGRARAPLVRVTALTGQLSSSGLLSDREEVEMVWFSQGVRMAVVAVLGAEVIPRLQEDDWALIGRFNGIHDDMGDVGVSNYHGVRGEAVLIGSDGGVFRRTGKSIDEWESASGPTNGTNSLQITDLLGTSVQGSASDSDAFIHFATQDNAVWGSTNNGVEYASSDCCEGFHLEGPNTTERPDAVIIGYGRLGAGDSPTRFSDLGLVNPRNVENTTSGSVTIQNFGQAFYLSPDRWLRQRGAVGGNPAEIYTSTDNGVRWRKRFNLNVNSAGVIQQTNTQFASDTVSAYLPVFNGDQNPNDLGARIGLVRLNNLYENNIRTIGSADVILLPESGSLGRRATEFDWQAVFGVHPKDGRYIIAPDIVNERVMVTRNGGDDWFEDMDLTRVVTQRGQLKMQAGLPGASDQPYFAQVTHIEFNPHNIDQIFVGTRDAGVICSNNYGVTWKTIENTDRIRYITGFHFFENGNVLVSSYGTGMWKIKRASLACDQGEDWRLPIDDVSVDENIGQSLFGGPLLDLGDDSGAKLEPSGNSNGLPTLSIASGIGVSGSVYARSGDDLLASVSDVDMSVGNLEVLIDNRVLSDNELRIATNEKSLSIVIPLSDDVSDGRHVLKIEQPATKSVAVTEFIKIREEDDEQSSIELNNDSAEQTLDRVVKQQLSLRQETQ